MGVQIKLSSVKHLKLDKTNKHIVIYKTLQTEGQIVSFQIENGLLIYLKRDILTTDKNCESSQINQSL